MRSLKNNIFATNDGPTGAPDFSNLKSQNNTAVHSNLLHDPYSHRLLQVSRNHQNQEPISLKPNSLTVGHKDSKSEEIYSHTLVSASPTISGEVQNQTQDPPEDALALLTFSKTVALGVKKDDSNLKDNHVNRNSANSVPPSFRKAAKRSIDLEHISRAHTKALSPKFQYPIDFAAGVILRQKVLLPIFHSHLTSHNAMKNGHEPSENEALHLEIISKFSKFMRGEQVHLVLANHDDLNDADDIKKRKRAQFFLNESDLNVSDLSEVKKALAKKRFLSKLNDSMDKNNSKKQKQSQEIHVDHFISLNKNDLRSLLSKDRMSENSLNLQQQDYHHHHHYHQANKQNSIQNNNDRNRICSSAFIRRCEGKDAKILSTWYHQLGDKYLVQTSPSWSNWWEEKCKMPDACCEMMKLTIPASPLTSMDQQKEEHDIDVIAGVVYYERNVPDTMRNGNRSTIIYGIRINPQYNPEVINRSQLIPSTLISDKSNINEIVKALFTAVLFNSLLCGTSSVSVSSNKNEMEEQFYRDIMGDAIFFRDEDGRKYFMIEGNDRFSFLRSQFEKQLDLDMQICGTKKVNNMNQRNERKSNGHNDVNPRSSNRDMHEILPKGFLAQAEHRKVSGESSSGKIKFGQTGQEKLGFFKN